jgi:hypothetical protein
VIDPVCGMTVIRRPHELQLCVGHRNFATLANREALNSAGKSHDFFDM